MESPINQIIKWIEDNITCLKTEEIEKFRSFIEDNFSIVIDKKNIGKD